MTRLRPPGIVPLELWDLRVGEGILWQHMHAADFGRVLREALIEVWQGRAESRSDGQVPEMVRNFRGLYLMGGGAVRVKDALALGPWQSTHLGVRDDFAGEDGAKSLLAARGLAGWMLDLGQSALKISAAGRRNLWMRNLQRLPIREDNVSHDTAAQRAELRRFVAEALREWRESVRDAPEAIVCALPSRLDDAGVPEGCSYIGMQGDVHLLPESLAAAGLCETKILVLNDAELGAVSAQLDSCVQSRTLVVTLGFGVGAAMIQ